MSNSTIYGTVKEMKVNGRTHKGQVSITLTLTRSDGQIATLTKTSVDYRIAAELTPGSCSRFYFAEIADMKVLGAIRMDNGVRMYLFPDAWRSILAIMAILNAAIFALYVVMDGKVRFLPLGVAMLVGVMWVIFTRRKSLLASLYLADQDLVVQRLSPQRRTSPEPAAT